MLNERQKQPPPGSSVPPITTQGILLRIFVVWIVHIVGFFLFKNVFLDAVTEHLQGEFGLPILLFYPLRDFIALPLAFYYFRLRRSTEYSVRSVLVAPFLPTLVLGLPVSMIRFFGSFAFSSNVDVVPFLFNLCYALVCVAILLFTPHQRFPRRD